MIQLVLEEVTLNYILKYFTVPLFGFSSSGMSMLLIFFHLVSSIFIIFSLNFLKTICLLPFCFTPFSHPTLHVFQSICIRVQSPQCYFHCELHFCDAIIFSFTSFLNSANSYFIYFCLFICFPQGLYLYSPFLVYSGNTRYFLFAKEQNHCIISVLYQFPGTPIIIECSKDVEFKF